MNNKLVLFVIFLISLIAWDAYSRFTINSQSAETAVNDKLVSIDLPKVLSTENLLALKQQYLTYDPQALDQTKLVDEQGMSLAEQQQQQGLLEQLYSGDLRISLKAVIREPVKGKNSDSIFALLLVENLKEQQQNLEKVTLLQQLWGYQVQKIQLDKITLVSQNDKSREIILPLYQKHLSAKGK